eukprot:scaffold4737_cov163-Skeletonema_dohrnii-CCMP3373.AAC.1
MEDHPMAGAQNGRARLRNCKTGHNTTSQDSVDRKAVQLFDDEDLDNPVIYTLLVCRRVERDETDAASAIPVAVGRLLSTNRSSVREESSGVSRISAATCKTLSFCSMC